MIHNENVYNNIISGKESFVTFKDNFSSEFIKSITEIKVDDIFHDHLQQINLAHNCVLHSELIDVNLTKVKLINGFNSLSFYIQDNQINGPAVEVIENNFLNFNYQKGVRQGSACLNKSNGETIRFSYRDNKRTGTAHSIGPMSTLFFEYVDNARQGAATLVKDRGENKKDILKFNYRDGLEHSSAFQKNADGSHLAFSFRDGKADNRATAFGNLPDGKKYRFEFYFNNNVRQGNTVYTIFDQKAKQIMYGTYVNGVHYPTSPTMSSSSSSIETESASSQDLSSNKEAVENK